MSKSWNRPETWITVVVLGIGALVLGIVGLFAYMSLTAMPLHPDAAAVPAVASGTPRGDWAPAVEQARRIARNGLVDQNLPGLSVAVGIGTDLVWAEGFGWVDLGRREPVTPATRFRTGEVSKALTSAGVGLLLESGGLRLDDEIQVYVPEYPRKPWPVTLRHLMAHTAGLRDDPGDEAPLANVIGDQGLPNRRCDRVIDALPLFADQALLFEPGTKYQRSTYGWILVSAAVERAAGDPFFRFMQDRIFEPLGMAATRPDSAAEPIADVATFYFPRFAGDPRYGPESAREGDHSCFAGASAFLSTPSDLVRFGLAVTGGTLLTPDTVRTLQTPQRLASGEETGFGLGWAVEAVTLAGAPARMAGHGSKADFIGGTAYLMTFAERGLVVAVQSNISFADAREIAQQVAGVFAAAGR